MGSSFRWMGMAPDNKTITLKRFEGQFDPPDYVTDQWLSENHEIVGCGVGLDVETTGLSAQTDKVIEVGLQAFSYHRKTGELLRLEDGYAALEDPGQPLSKEIVQLTGITDEALSGQVIDWEHVGAVLDGADIIVAHNASFDRAFIDRKVPISREKLWACSCSQINWQSKGFNTRKLELLNIYHGFFTDSHRALHDVEALLYLLRLPDPNGGTPYFKELVENAYQPRVKMIACGSPFETKDLLKRRGYRWNVKERYWSKAIPKETQEEETSWLTDSVYGGAFGGRTVDIPLTDNFKSL